MSERQYLELKGTTKWLFSEGKFALVIDPAIQGEELAGVISFRASDSRKVTVVRIRVSLEKQDGKTVGILDAVVDDANVQKLTGNKGFEEPPIHKLLGTARLVVESYFNKD